MQVSFNSALIDLADSPFNSKGWLPGCGIFETIKTLDGKVFAFGEHMQRALTSAAIAGLPFPNLALIESSVAALLITEPVASGFLRISFDTNCNWGAIHLPYLQQSLVAKVRIHPDAFDVSGADIKSYPYDHRLAVLKEAQILGFDEAIILNSDGNICEGCASNIIMEIDGRWVTPATSDGVLPGIMRALVIAELAVGVESIPISRVDDITSAFLLSSLRISTPIESIGGRQLQVSHALNEQIHAMAVPSSVG